MIRRDRPAVSRRAVSMVEIAIAVLILAVAVIPIFAVFISNSEETRANKNRSYAAVLAASTLERFKRCDRKFLADTFKDAIPDPGTLDKTSFPGGDAGSQGVAKDTLLNPGPGSGTSDPSDVLLKEFHEVVKGRFRRYLRYDDVNDPSGGKSDHIGKLTCMVVWTEKTAGITRILSYSLGCLVTDPVLPGND